MTDIDPESAATSPLELALLNRYREDMAFIERARGASDESLHDMVFDLVKQSYEVNKFLLGICQGKLDSDPPGRTNTMAGPIKELHAQLTALAWSMDQLAAGRMVSKPYYSGQLFTSFNKLVDKVAALSGAAEHDETSGQRDGSHNSWRYHKLLSALNNLRIMVLEVADDGRILYANRSAKQYLNGPDRQSKPAYESFSSDSHADEERALFHYLAEFRAAGRDFPVCEEIFEKDSLWYQVTTDRVVFHDDSTGCFHVVEDISGWKRQEHNLKRTASTDALTKIYNRRVGMQALENALSPSGPHIVHCAAFIDLDNLKTINDSCGHAEGDRAIQAVADVLSASVRENDIVCRYGGDEFLIVFVRCNLPAAEKVIARMYEKLAEKNAGGTYPKPLSFSHGLIEIAPEVSVDIPDLIVKMDRLMYENKRAKKEARQK